MAHGNKFQFSSFFTKGQYETQVERLEVMERGKGLSIGIAKESNPNESRVLLVPNAIRSLVGYGHKVVVESNAGILASFQDTEFSSAGAEISKNRDEVFQCHIVVKSSPPELTDLELMSPGQILITPLQLPVITKKYLEKLKSRKVVGIALEHLRYEDGSFPFIKMMSELAGRLSIVIASNLLADNISGRGVLLGGVSGVPPAKVVILGAGVVGENAAKTALALGASVRIFDNDIYKIMQLQDNIGQQLHSSSLNPEYMAYQLTSADVVIGAMHSKSGRAPVLVTEEMVSKMKKGSVIVDVSIDQGGCIETSRVTSHSDPVFEKHGVIHYCVPNMSSKVARTSSMAVSNFLVSLILKLGSGVDLQTLLYQHEGIRSGIYCYEGHITQQHLAQSFEMKYTALELLMTSSH